MVWLRITFTQTSVFRIVQLVLAGRPAASASVTHAELLNDGGYFTVKIDPTANQPARFTFHPLPR